MSTEVKDYDFSDFDFSEISGMIFFPDGDFEVQYSNGETDFYSNSTSQEYVEEM